MLLGVKRIMKTERKWKKRKKEKKMHQNRVKYLKFASIYAGENIHLKEGGGG